jgi:hypothetical protein
MFIGFKHINLIDVSSEKFTFGQRIFLGKIDTTSSHKIIEQVMSVLYGVKVKPWQYKSVYAHILDVLNKLNKWSEIEKALNYEPTAEEKQAGIKQITDKLQDFATVDAIAKRMHISHDNAMKLPYAIVFQMLQSDLEHSKFERRLSKVYEQKYKRK